MTDQTYHLLCEKCGYDRWSEDGFQECPKCEDKDLLTELSSYLFMRLDTPEDEADSAAKYITELLQRFGWKSPEEVQQRVDDARLIYKEKVLEALFEELYDHLVDYHPSAAASEWFADFKKKHLGKK